MNKKMLGGIIVLVVLIGIAGVFLLIGRNTNTEPKKVYNLPEFDASQKAPEVTKLPLGETTQGGHWHDGEWHEEPHTTPMPTVEPHVHTWTELSLEERKQLVEIFYRERGLKPPPEGYEYRWASPDVPMLDDNGEPILHPIGEPIVEVETGIGFAPTPAQYERYKALQVQYSQHMQAGNIAEAEQIATDIALLEKDAEGEIPIVRVTLKTSGLSDKEHYERLSRAGDTEIRKAYEAAGLGHLFN